jgi:hypothetical protein
VVEEADMRERALRTIPFRDGKVSLSFRPFEIKTLLVRLAAVPGALQKATRS